MEVGSFSFPSLQEVFPSSPLVTFSGSPSLGGNMAGNFEGVVPVAKALPIGLTEFSMDPSVVDGTVSNELFKLLDAKNKTRFLQLLIPESDDAYVKQIKSLSTEILLLRSKVQDKMVAKSVSSDSSGNLRGSPVPPPLWKEVINHVKEGKHLELKFYPHTPSLQSVIELWFAPLPLLERRVLGDGSVVWWGTFWIQNFHSWRLDRLLSRFGASMALRMSFRMTKDSSSLCSILGKIFFVSLIKGIGILEESFCC
ncbi:hypothetical protein RHMOL_Rhmol11G0044400 [Rhododendron molle]|uniref:Uncharacterized protein n=1 Tax=Rhododendron molle TaxID=49168 RepID=A0ACC0LNS5_RHOML|nr:hypothetical protein RHMOL_Rhmol11G0044400 [Rhododendron molle]